MFSRNKLLENVGRGSVAGVASPKFSSARIIGLVKSHSANAVLAESLKSSGGVIYSDDITQLYDVFRNVDEMIQDEHNIAESPIFKYAINDRTGDFVYDKLKVGVADWSVEAVASIGEGGPVPDGVMIMSSYDFVKQIEETLQDGKALVPRVVSNAVTIVGTVLCGSIMKRCWSYEYTKFTDDMLKHALAANYALSEVKIIVSVMSNIVKSAIMVLGTAVDTSTSPHKMTYPDLSKRAQMFDNLYRLVKNDIITILQLAGSGSPNTDTILVNKREMEDLVLAIRKVAIRHKDSTAQNTDLRAINSMLLENSNRGGKEVMAILPITNHCLAVCDKEDAALAIMQAINDSDVGSLKTFR